MYLTVYSVSQLSSSLRRIKLASLSKRVREKSLLQSAVSLRGTVSLRETVPSKEIVSSRGIRSEAVSRLNKL